MSIVANPTRPLFARVERSTAQLLAGAVFSFLALTPPATGVPINYGSFSGTSVDYIDVSEDSATDAVPLYGTPTFGGDSLSFSPTTFASSAASGAGDETVGNLTFRVQAHAGNYIGMISFSEAGTTTLAGLSPVGSTGTASAVIAAGTLVIHQVDFGAIAPVSIPFSLVFSPSGGTYFLGTDGGGGPTFLTLWAGSAILDLATILVSNGVPFIDGATLISLDMDNSMETLSESGTSAAIDKNSFFVTVSSRVTALPEPSSLSLSGLALLALLLCRRRLRA